MLARLTRLLPDELKPLAELAFDLRWTGSQTANRLWQRLDPEIWDRTRNPVAILLSAHEERLREACRDEELLAEMRHWLERLARHEAEPTWLESVVAEGEPPPRVAYFSMEFGLSEALPIYSGGLGMLAGDHLKSASSQGVPLTGIGLLYQQGYFRQVIDEDGNQVPVSPFNEPGSLPITPVQGPDGRWPRVRLALPGRTLMLRIWEARVGRVRLLLLDSNDPMNSPEDRPITGQLYHADRRTRLLQELVLGVGGWQALEKLGIEAEVCHLNEGHAAFAVVARAASYAAREGVPFDTAWWATRAGNVFTTHTPVAAAFDRYEPDLLATYAQPLAESAGLSRDEFLELGREPEGGMFNMAFLAMRGCARVNGVSRLHGEVSRRLFSPLFPGWPLAEVPVSHVTNGVHVPTWDSAAANACWRGAYPGSWSRHLDEAAAKLRATSDAELWAFRNAARADLVAYVRHRLVRRSREHGRSRSEEERGGTVLDPKALTIGFARRFTGYKRPGLLLADLDRIVRLLTDPHRPVQLIIAGKAHPNDGHGVALVREAVRFCLRDEVWDRAIFLEDYDMAVAAALTGGVDVWLNNPARPNEACGTSGMKALVNGGLHLSTLDGWWDEAFDPEVGWAFGGRDEDGADTEAADARELHDLLESEVIPEFYERDEHGLPRRWLRRVRASMSRLVPRFSSDRMVRDYTDVAYRPAARQYRHRTAGRAAVARDLQAWHAGMVHAWKDVRFVDGAVRRDDGGWTFAAELVLGGLTPEEVRVELYREDPWTGAPEIRPMRLVRPAASAGEPSLYVAEAPAEHPAEHYTARVTARHPELVSPLETPFIRWQK
jgi:starch phosphorylase